MTPSCIAVAGARRTWTTREVIGIELRHLRYFIAVAEELNFSRAAVSLATAQPSLSQQIRQLEAEIGVELFERAKRRIVLTPAGSEFLSEARAIVAHVESAISHAREAGRGLRGELRVAYTVSAMISTLPVAIRDFRTGHPDVRLTLSAMPPAALLDALRRREADVGILLVRSTAEPGDIALRGLQELPFGVLVPAGHRLAGRRTIAVGEIGGDTLILFARHLASMYDAVIALCAQRGFVPAKIEEADRVETILGLVAAGEGISIVPRLYERLGYPGITFAGISPEPEPLTMAVASVKTVRSALTAAFVATCERIASLSM